MRVKRRLYIPVVLTRDEVTKVISHLYPPYNLVVKTQYGCGLRLFECVKLRVQDFNFDDGILTVRGKGGKVRTVPLPQAILPELKKQLEMKKGDITCTTPTSRRPSEPLSSRLNSLNASRHIPSVTASPRTFCRPTTTSVQFRCFSAIPMSGRR